MKSKKLVKSTVMILVLLLSFTTLSSCAFLSTIASLPYMGARQEIQRQGSQKSALLDAENALSIYLAENTNDVDGSAAVADGTVFEVKKANESWYFFYSNNGGLSEASNIHEMPNCGDKIDVSDIAGFPEHVTMYYPAQ